MDKQIETYKLEVDFNFPLARNHNEVISGNPGDKVVSIDNEVFIRDLSSKLNSDSHKSYAKVLCGKEFLDLNPTIFKLQ